MLLPARPGRGARLQTVSALAVGLALGLALTGCSGSDEEAADDPAPKASASATPSPTAAPTATGSKVDPGTLPAATVKAVGEGSTDYYEALTDALGDPSRADTDDPEEFEGITGAALAELVNTLTEYEENGWRVEGEATVVDQEVVRATKDPDTVVVRACVDNSAIRIVDRNGDEVPNSRSPKPRTRNVLTLVRDGDSWVVAAQRPATRPNC
ncbi:hypothetical protein [Nocardioides daphniae]|uniref:hypothetical protein n=1 Tax=Nocardioides daphniae TaxID=402297 RepID=UPI001668CD3C|nr:hypothetical protein [Nocardioides daphniae]